MNLIKFFGFGVIIWDIAFVTEAILNTLAVQNTIVTQIVFIIISIITFLLSENLEIVSEKEIFKYGIVWAITMMGLDFVVSNYSLEYNSFSEYSTWINYLIVVLMPVLSVKANKNNG